MWVAGKVPRPQVVSVLPVELATALRASLAACGAWVALLEVVWSLEASQKQARWLKGGSCFSRCRRKSCRLPGRSVALGAAGKVLVASWGFQEGGGGLELEW